ncbi:MAG: TIR domain-containing protein [Anaerolineaceae bacterium]|nr:TIR domain-containing protein [Anaerolineaceae bacterium]
MDFGPIVLVVVILVLVVAAALFWRRLNAASPENTREANTVSEKSNAVTDSLRANASREATEVLPIPLSDVSPGVMAALDIEQGPDAFVDSVNVGRHIEIRDQRVTIGRSPKTATIQLYNVDEVSSVSRLHCTLEFHKTLRCFMITDEGSSSGTKVAGKIIPPRKAHSLKDGDLIELGMIDQAGAILRFRTTYDALPERLSIEPLVEQKDTVKQAVGRPTAPIRQDVFLSYSRRDKTVMRMVRDALLDASYTVWSDESVEPGSPSWKNDVQQAIEGAGCVIAILSPDAKESEWVSEELNYARIHKKRMFTVLVRGDESNAIPFGLTGMQWVDMRMDYDDGMKELMQQSALEQLVATVREHLGK